MSLCDGNKYSAYMLELVRNNGIRNADKDKEIGNEKRTQNENTSSFLMFDYFDVLYCKELRGEDKKYLNYLSIENAYEDAIKNSKDYRVSYKTLSLYCKSDNKSSESHQGNIFSIVDTGEKLSEAPFLGLIQISLCKDNYIREDLEGINIDAFLEKCEQKIMEIANKYITCKTRTKLFRSSTTGDFCLVLRTDSVKAIHNVAVALNGTQNNDEKDSLKMLTFTNVGIECRYRENEGYATLSKNYTDDHSEIIVALRFSGDESLSKALQCYIKDKPSGKIEAIKGLFGRYEYLVHIGLKEFSGIYPFLCEKKFRECESETKKSEIRKSELEKILRDSCIRNINERILVELVNEDSYESDELNLPDNKQNGLVGAGDRGRSEIFAKNEALFGSICDLEDLKKYFYEDHFAFQDLIRGMKEICKAFTPAGMDKESYINWQIFHQDMSILCECIKWMLDDYKEWEKNPNIGRTKKKRYRRIVLEDWRVNLQAINRYTTLTQNVNYQTYQAPIYEIQTQIDTEKALVAYREAMELYIDGAIRERRERESDKNTGKVYPIIYPDLSKDKVEIAAPFMVKSSGRGVIPKREIICTVPSFEYFGRLYDLLPWVLHETSHHLNVLQRKNRNDFVVEYIFSYIFKIAMNEALQKLSNCDYYVDIGEAEQYLLRSMTKAAKEEIRGKTGYDNFNFERLMLEIDNWLRQMFPSGAGYDAAVYKETEEQLKRKVFQFWLDAYRKEEILSEEYLEKILGIWEGDDLELREDLAKKLLETYFTGLPEEVKRGLAEYKICIEDIYEDGLMRKKLTGIIQLYGKEKGDQASGKNKAIVKDYCCKIIELSRIVNINMKNAEKKSDSDNTKNYLKRVFAYYKEAYGDEKEKNNMLIDGTSMHIMRNLGLLSDKLEVFQSRMNRIMHSVDNVALMRQKNIKIKIYLETSADLLMATSLQLNSFGYCRQVLQTLSDAKIEDEEGKYEDVNYERWRTVAAVLLAEEEAGDFFEAANGIYKIKAANLIEKSKTYCRYTFKCIKEKLLKEKYFKGDQDRQEKLLWFLKEIQHQINENLGKHDVSDKKKFMLNILFPKNEKQENHIPEEWNEYTEIIEKCESVKYNFWRIACFCRGIGNIVSDGHIIVQKELFDHMKAIREIVNSKSARGCKWEKDLEYLIGPKQDVGEFYNIPEQVHEKTPAQKLENTIDFIQNYYYHNRFRIMNMDI